MRYLLLAWCLVTAPLLSEDSSCLPLAEVQGDPSAVVAGCVNVITGAYIVSDVDLSVPAASPIYLQRHYSSSDSSAGAFFNAWNHNFPCKGSIGAADSKYTATFPVAGGDVLHKSHANCRERGGGEDESPHAIAPKKDVCFEIFDDGDHGMTNTSSGRVGGRTNVKNQRVRYEAKWNRVSVVRCDGGTQYFSKEGKRDKTELLPLNFRLDSEKHPNGNLTVYSYANNKLCGVLTQDRQGSHLGRLDIGWVTLDKHRSGIRVSASNGQHITYEPCSVGGNQYIGKAVHSSGYWESYAYTPTKKRNNVRMWEHRRPDGRFRQLDYYHEGDNSTDVRHVNVKERKKDGLTIDRVKHIKAPVGHDSTPYVTHCLIYDKWDWLGASRVDYTTGHVNVYDAFHHKTHYRISRTQHLDFIERYLGDRDANYCLYSRERFYWGGPRPNQQCDLIAKCIEDANGSVRSSRYLEYDQDHNVVVETILGNLSGKCSIFPSVNAQGVPLDNGTERCVVRHTYSQDAFHLCLSDTLPNGCTHRYAYHSGTNLLASKLVGDGQRILSRQFFEYDSCGAPIKVIEDNGSGTHPTDMQGVTVRKIVYSLNRREAPAVGLPEEVIECYLDTTTGCEKQLTRRVHHYSSEGWLIQQDVYDKDDVFAYTLLWEHDPSGRIILEQDAIGQITARRYDLNGNKIFEQGPDSRFYEEYIYDFSDRLIAKNRISADGQCFTESYKYNTLSQRIASFDIYGNETNFFYDDLGRLTKTVGPASPERLSISQEYDIVGNVVAKSDLGGHITRTRYNIRGQPCEVQHPDGTTERYEYTVEGRLERYTAPNQTTTSHFYDVLGNEIRKETYSADGSLLTTTTASYYGPHKVSETDANGNCTTYQYDGAGRLVLVKQAHSWKKLEYDSLGRNHRTVQFIGPDERHVQVQCVEYDLLGRAVEERLEDVHGTVLTRALFTYDSAGNRNSQTTFSADGPCTTYTDYNCHGQVERTVNAEGHETFTYYNHTFPNTNGQRVLQITVVDALGNQTITTHDVLNRVESVVQKDPFGTETAKTFFVYNAIGKLIRRVDTVKATGLPDYDHLIEWKYDAIGRVIEVIDAVGTTQERQRHFHYNILGQKEWEILYDGTRLCYAYDAFGRVVDYHTSDRSIAYHYTYDGNGNLLEVNDQKQGTSNLRSYDSANRIVSETLDNGLSMRYRYDGLGRVIHVELPDDSGIGYDYDAGFLRAVHRLDPSQTSTFTHQYLTYDLAGGLLTSQLAGQAGTLTYQRDKLGRVRELRTDVFQEVIPEEGYDAVGNLMRVHSHDVSGSVTCDYSYDALYQLASEEGVFSTSYAHDSLNNRRAKGSTLYEVDVLNQLTRQGDVTYQYDLCGQRTGKHSSKGDTNYTYDAIGRLIAVSVEGRRHTYTYDAFNRRLTRTTPDGLQERYLYQDQSEIGTVDEAGQLRQLRVLGSSLGAERGAAVLVECEQRTFVPIHNGRGHAVALVDVNTGHLVEAYRFGAFGEETSCLDAAPINPWRFCSKRCDSETELIAFGRRYYDTEVGRWITPDPKGYDDGPNLYAYVHNNPLTRFDAYGLYTEDYDWFVNDSEFDCFDCNDIDSFLARAYGPLAYSASCGCAKGSLDFAISSVHAIESQITHIGAESLDLGCDLCCQIHHALHLEQQERCAAIDGWVMDRLQIEQDDAVYHNCCYATTVGMEAGTLLAGAYGVVKGCVGLYRGARSCLCCEAAITTAFEEVSLGQSIGISVELETQSSNVVSLINLNKSLASQSQMGEIGITIAGGEGNTPLRASNWLAQKYGGMAQDWVKKSSSSYTALDGLTFETHWVENCSTGQRMEFKTKLFRSN